MRFCSSFCYAPTQIKRCRLSQNKAGFRSKRMHSQGLYYEAKPDLRWASLLKRVFKIQVSGTRETKSYKVKFTKSKAFTGALGSDKHGMSCAAALVQGPGKPMQGWPTPAEEQDSCGGVRPCYPGKRSIHPGQRKQDNGYFSSTRPSSCRASLGDLPILLSLCQSAIKDWPC